MRLSLALLAWLLVAPGFAVELSGRLAVAEGSRGQLDDLASVYVVWEPASHRPVAVPDEPLTMETRDKEFAPRILLIRPGQRVRFPNFDPILHNVFSVSPENPFDLGLYGDGESREHRFESPGLVRVYCNVHHGMVGYIWVVDSPHTARADAEGRFRLSDLPSGSGTIRVWHERAAPWSRELTLPLDAPLEVELEIERRRLPRHLDKDGKPYRKRRERDYR